MNVVNFPVFFLCDIFWTAVRIRVIFLFLRKEAPSGLLGVYFRSQLKDIGN